MITITSSRGFTLIEVLIALVIAAMGTVTLGYFTAGAGRLHTETLELSAAGALADTAIELIVLHHQVNHPEIIKLLNSAENRGWTVKIHSLQPVIKSKLTQIHIVISSPDLKLPVTVSRLLHVYPSGNHREK